MSATVTITEEMREAYRRAYHREMKGYTSNKPVPTNMIDACQNAGLAAAIEASGVVSRVRALEAQTRYLTRDLMARTDERDARWDAWLDDAEARVREVVAAARNVTTASDLAASAIGRARAAVAAHIAVCQSSGQAFGSDDLARTAITASGLLGRVQELEADLLATSEERAQYDAAVARQLQDEVRRVRVVIDAARAVVANPMSTNTAAEDRHYAAMDALEAALKAADSGEAA